MIIIEYAFSHSNHTLMLFIKQFVQGYKAKEYMLLVSIRNFVNWIITSIYRKFNLKEVTLILFIKQFVQGYQVVKILMVGK